MKYIIRLEIPFIAILSFKKIVFIITYFIYISNLIIKTCKNNKLTNYEKNTLSLIEKNTSFLSILESSYNLKSKYKNNLISDYKNNNYEYISSVFNDPEYGDDLEGIMSVKQSIDRALNKNDTEDKYNNLKKDNRKNSPIGLLSQIDSKVDIKEINALSANLIKDDKDSKIAFTRLNSIANLYRGKEILKAHGKLNDVLKLILNDKSKSIEIRVMSAKLVCRIHDIPTTFQITEEDNKKRSSSNLDAFVAVPRIQRLYENDKYIENYKAGNWNP